MRQCLWRATARHWSLLLVLLVGGVGGVGGRWEPSHAAAAPQPVAPAFLAVDGYLVTGPFLAFYQTHGGADAFGGPRTDALVEADGLTVQYFAFACFEWRGDHVALRHLGRRAAVGHPNATAFTWQPPEAPVAAGRTYRADSGHTLGGAIGWYWQTHGAAPILGLPISEELREEDTGQVVQYFERAVLTYDPTAAGTLDEVRRTPLGTRAAPAAPPAPAPRLLATATLPVRGGSPEAQNIAAAAAHLHGLVIPDGARLSFLGTVGPVTAANGYGSGPAIVGGQLVSNDIGGGICMLSTLLYRTAWHAGLPILARQPHSAWLRVFADAPGLEAAVADPGPDLVIRNDTGAVIIVEATVDGDHATLRLWGQDDGRQVAVVAPTVRLRPASGGSRSAGGLARAVPDPSTEGATVENVRVIRPPHGPARREVVVTRYAPTPAEVPTPLVPEERPS